jgi:hypothetical protein
MGKISPFRKSRKVFWPIQNRPKGFKNTIKNFFWKKRNKSIKRQPKTEERRAFENLLANCECADNPSWFLIPVCYVPGADGGHNICPGPMA